MKVKAITDNHKSAGLRSISRINGPRSQKTCMARSQIESGISTSRAWRNIPFISCKPMERFCPFVVNVLFDWRNCMVNHFIIESSDKTAGWRSNPHPAISNLQVDLKHKSPVTNASALNTSGDYIPQINFQCPRWVKLLVR